MSNQPETAPTEASLTIAPCPHCGATQDALDKDARKGVYAYLDAPGKSHAKTMRVACLECGSGAPSTAVWNLRQPETDLAEANLTIARMSAAHDKTRAALLAVNAGLAEQRDEALNALRKVPIIDHPCLDSERRKT